MKSPIIETLEQFDKMENEINNILYSEKSKQGTSPEPLVSDTRLLDTGCSSEASGNSEDEWLDAAPLGHKIHDEKVRIHVHNHVLGDDGIWYCECGDSFLDDYPDL